MNPEPDTYVNKCIWFWSICTVIGFVLGVIIATTWF